jgi:hypothetical protein
MDIDIFIKIGTFVLGLFGAGKLLYDLSIGKRGRLREEYRFAREFFEDAEASKPLHPFLREKGYRAIAGDERLNADEVEYLLSLQKADRALRDYVLGRPYLEHFPQVGNLQIDFKLAYKSPWSRTWRKYTYFTLYAGLFFLAFSPFLLSRSLFKNATEMLTASALCMVVFGPYAWLSLKSATRIHRAEKLVQHQDKHTQRIVLETESVRSRITEVTRSARSDNDIPVH